MIKPTKQTVIPTGPDQYSFQIVGGTNLTPAGEAHAGQLVLKRFRANPDGSNPTEIPGGVTVPLNGPDAATVAFTTGLETLVQTLVTAKGL